MAWLLVADGGDCEVAALRKKRNDYGHEGSVRGRYDDCAVDVDTVRPSASAALRSSTDCSDVESPVHVTSSNCFLQPY